MYVCLMYDGCSGCDIHIRRPMLCMSCLVLYVSLVVVMLVMYAMSLHRDACYVSRTLHARISVHYIQHHIR